MPLRLNGQLEEVDANVPAGERVWRETGSGYGATLAIKEASLATIGIEPDSGKDKSKDASNELASKAPTKATRSATGAKKAKPAMTDAPAKKTAPKAPTGTTERTPREGMKEATMITMLQRKKGATIAEIVETMDWQQHTFSGAFTEALKKKLGITIVSKKVDGRG